MLVPDSLGACVLVCLGVLFEGDRVSSISEGADEGWGVGGAVGTAVRTLIGTFGGTDVVPGVDIGVETAVGAAVGRGEVMGAITGLTSTGREAAGLLVCAARGRSWIDGRLFVEIVGDSVDGLTGVRPLIGVAFRGVDVGFSVWG